MGFDPGRGRRGVAGPVLAEAGGDGDGAVVLGGVGHPLLGQVGRRGWNRLEEVEALGGRAEVSLTGLEVGREGGAGEGGEDGLGLHRGGLEGPWRRSSQAIMAEKMVSGIIWIGGKKRG